MINKEQQQTPNQLTDGEQNTNNNNDDNNDNTNPYHQQQRYIQSIKNSPQNVFQRRQTRMMKQHLRGTNNFNRIRTANTHKTNKQQNKTSQQTTATT